MAGEDIFQDFRNIQREIKFLINSDNRLEILECLIDSPQTLKSIQRCTGLASSSISTNISQLQERGHVASRNDVYFLNNRSFIILNEIFSLNKSINLLDKNSRFLNSHMLDEVPADALKSIELLESSHIVKSSATDIFKIITVFREFGTGARFIKTIFPFMHPQLMEIFEYWFGEKIDVKLILHDDVFEEFSKAVNSYISRENLDCRISAAPISRQLHIALAISDKGIVLGFYRMDGKFDQNALYVSDSRDAISWANNVYSEYESECGEYTHY